MLQSFVLSWLTELCRRKETCKNIFLILLHELGYMNLVMCHVEKLWEPSFCLCLLVYSNGSLSFSTRTMVATIIWLSSSTIWVLSCIKGCLIIFHYTHIEAPIRAMIWVWESLVCGPNSAWGNNKQNHEMNSILIYYVFFSFQWLLDFTSIGYSQFLWNRNLAVISLYHQILWVGALGSTRREISNKVVLHQLGLAPFHAPDVTKFTTGEEICFDTWGWNVERHHSSTVLIVRTWQNTKTTSSVMWWLDTGMFLNTARFHMMAIDEASNNMSFLVWLYVALLYFVIMWS